MRYSSITILATIFLLFSTPVFGQMVGKEKMMNVSNVSEMMEFIKNVREEHGIHGLGFFNSEESTLGEFVTFSVDNKTGNVLNYSVMGTKLFDISIDNFGFVSTENVGTTTLVTGDNSRIVITDSPAAVLTIISTRPQTVTFTMASTANAENIGPENVDNNLVKITSGKITGELIGNNITISGNRLTVKTSPSGVLVFRVSPVNMPMFGDLQDRIAQQIANNRMGTEVSINSNTVSTANFTDVETNVQAMGSTSISMKVSSSTTTGRTISINLDNSSLVVGDNQKLAIKFDGKDLQCVNDPNMVLNGTDQPACWISPIQDGKAQMLIFIPHFSEHNIEIAVETISTETPVATENIIPENTTPMQTPTPKSPGFDILATMTILFSAFAILRRNH